MATISLLWYDPDLLSNAFTETGNQKDFLTYSGLEKWMANIL